MPDTTPVVVVTGGAGGIGEAAVRQFAQQGARVVFGDLRHDKGAAIAAELGAHVRYQPADVRHEAEIERLIDTAIREFGTLDVMVNNAAAGGTAAPIEHITAEGWDETLALTLRSAVLGMKHAARRMGPARGGAIVNVASIAGLQTGNGPHTYSAAKAAVISLTRTTAMELGERGIRVNCVCPGGVGTGIFGGIAGMPADMAERAGQAIAPLVSAGAALPTVCTPEDIAAAICWLARPGGAFVNGHALVVDGGTTGGRKWSQSQAEGRQIMQALGQAA